MGTRASRYERVVDTRLCGRASDGEGEVDAVIVGADRSAKNGDVINKVGTYPIAALAKEYGVPFYALVQDPRALESGADVPIEERPSHELLTFRGTDLLIDNGLPTLSSRYPSFDVTPAALSLI